MVRHSILSFEFTYHKIMSEQVQSIQLSFEFSDEHLLAISEATDVIACDCPGYLVRLLKEVREFKKYTSDCIEQFPSDAATHEWLSSRARQVELLLSLTIYELLEKEDLIDGDRHINLNRLSERNRELALKKTI